MEARSVRGAKISVIVPAYNAEATIEGCVRSIQSQNYQNIEIIVVNDCSSDETRNVVEALAAQDSRLKLMTPPENVGVHGARKLGVSTATGALIGFVDADDYVEPNMYSTLYERLTHAGASIAICSAALVSSGRRLPVLRVGIRSSGVVRSDILSRFCQLKFGSGVLWNKLYDRRVIEASAGLELERAVVVGEDYIVNFGAFARADAVVLCREPLYNYVVHSSNASAQRGWDALARLFRAYVVCLEKYAREDPRFSSLIDELYLKQLHFPDYRLASEDDPSSEAKEHLAESLRRLGEVNPVSIYSILHSLPRPYARVDELRKSLLGRI